VKDFHDEEEWWRNVWRLFLSVAREAAFISAQLHQAALNVFAGLLAYLLDFEDRLFPVRYKSTNTGEQVLITFAFFVVHELRP